MPVPLSTLSLPPPVMRARAVLRRGDEPAAEALLAHAAELADAGFDPMRLSALVDLIGPRRMDQLLDLFVSQCGVLVEAMTKAANAGDWAALRSHAHCLKGAAGSVGAVRVAVAADDAEQLHPSFVGLAIHGLTRAADDACRIIRLLRAESLPA